MADGVVAVGAFSSLSGRVVPQTSRHSGGAEHRVMVENAGNEPVSLTFDARDPDEVLHLGIDPTFVTVDPGATATVVLRVRALRPLGGSVAQPRPFTVTATAHGGRGASPQRARSSRSRPPRPLRPCSRSDARAVPPAPPPEPRPEPPVKRRSCLGFLFKLFLVLVLLVVVGRCGRLLRRGPDRDGTVVRHLVQLTMSEPRCPRPVERRRRRTGGRRGAVPVGRGLPGHAVPRRRLRPDERSGPARPARPGVERVRRVDRRGCPGPGVVPAGLGRRRRHQPRRPGDRAHSSRSPATPSTCRPCVVGAVAGPDRAAGGVPAPPAAVRGRHPAVVAQGRRRAPLRHHRHQPVQRHPVAVLPALHARLPHARDRGADGAAGRRGGGVGGVPSSAVAVHPASPPVRRSRRRPPRARAGRRSPTAASTTTSASSRCGSAAPRCS